MNKLLVAVLVVAVPAFAGGKDFKDGLSKDEVTKLTKSLGALTAKFNETKPSMEKLKKSPDVRKSSRLTALASEVLRHYTTVGVFLGEMERGLKKRDPKVNSFETELKGEIDQWELKLAALKEQAKAEHASSVAQLVAGTVILAAALDTLYVSFDTDYDVAVVDVDLVVIPVYDVYEVVHYTSPYVVIDHGDEYEISTDVAEYED